MMWHPDTKRLFVVLLVCAIVAQYKSVVADSSSLRHMQEEEEEQVVGNSEASTIAAPQQGINGGFSLDARIPWFAVFQDTQLCAGALVHEDIVLTTAHCVEGFKYPNQIRVNSLQLDTGGQVRNVLIGRIHPRYNGIIEQGYDIALLKLDVKINDPILATYNEFGNVPQNGQKIFVAGFGLTDDTTFPNRLQGLVYNYVENCQRRFPEYNPTWFLCGDASPERGTCGGDSGGATWINGTNNIVGLNSFSDGDCTQQTVDVYTRVSTYYDWILDEICNLAQKPPDNCPVCFLDGLSGALRSFTRFFGF